MRKIIVGILLSLIIMVFQVSPALAIGDPDDLTWGSRGSNRYKVITNVIDTGDMLFTAEVYLYYATEPTDYTASEAYLFEVLNTAGNETIASKPLEAYGNRPIGIYLSAAQVTSLGLVSGTAYGLRVAPNPSVMIPSATNNITAFLSSSSYTNQALSGNTTRTNNLRNAMMLFAEDIEAHDTPTISYLVTSQGIKYLSSAGANIFLEGIPGLDSMCPELFYYSSETLLDDQPTSTGSYAAILTPTTQWGATTANGLTHLGLYLGVNQALAGSAMALILGLLLAIFVYNKLQSGVATLMLMATYPFIAAWLGLMPLALAFVVMIMVVVLGGYYFFKQGAL